MGSLVLIHKVPALWEVDSKRNYSQPLQISDFEEISELSESENNFLASMKNDIFFLLARSVADYLEIEDIHIILCYDKNEVRNWDVIERNGVIRNMEGFVFWSSDSIERLPSINDVEVLLLRGNYPYFHNNIIREYSPKLSIFYPATSLLYPHFKERLSSWVEEIMQGSKAFDEIEMVSQSLFGKGAFSKIDAPKISPPKSKLEGLEMRKSLRNYCLNCIKIANSTRTSESPGNYSIVLYDEEKNHSDLSKKYPNSKLMKFNKASSPIFEIDLHSQRDIDILFTGTTIQKTKNPALFDAIVESILTTRPETKVAIVGVEGDKDKISNKWKGENVNVFGRISKTELCVLYNRSKTHLVTSGRDCFPRTIPESLSCGCYNLVLDILSDGTSVIEENPWLGKVVNTKENPIILQPSSSISLLVDQKSITSISEQIIEALDTEHNPLAISTLSREVLPLEQMVQLDSVWESADLLEF